MVKLTTTAINKFLGKTQEKQLEIADGNNLYLVVTKVGSCKFKYRIRTRMSASWVILGDYPAMTLDDARTQALQIKSSLKNGADISSIKKPQNKITLNTFAQQFIKERLPVARPKKASYDDFVRKFNTQILAVIGELYVADINDTVIRNQLINPKLSLNRSSMAIHIRDMLKSVLDYAVEKSIIASNPIASAKSYNIASVPSRNRYLTDQEIAQMLQLLYSSATIRTTHKIGIHLLLMLLMRKTELVHATWDNVDFEKSQFIIKDSKMGSQLLIPLPTQALALFKILKDLSEGSEFIFVGKDGNRPINDDTLNKQNNIINHIMFNCNKAQYFTIHDLRRTGATHLGELGYPSDYIEVALNHTKSGMKQVYQRSQYLEQRKEMLQKWADRLDTLIGDAGLLPYDKKFII